MSVPKQLYSLRGHLNEITCTELFYLPGDRLPSLISSDAKGWIIWWDMSRKRPFGTWKGHDSNIISIKQLENGYLLTHSKDSEIRIWDILNFKDFNTSLPRLDFNDTRYFNVNETNELSLSKKSLLREYPIPKFVSIPVNSLNFCNIDYLNSYLITPSTQSSNNFDIYSIFNVAQTNESMDSQLNLKRVVTNYDPWKLYRKTVNKKDGIDDEINTESNDILKRDKFGIMMKILFVKEDLFFIGYESGHVLGFNIDFKTTSTVTESLPSRSCSSKSKSGLPNLFASSNSSKPTINRTIINKDHKIKLIYINAAHSPNPIITLNIHENQLISGSTNKKIVVHDYSTNEQQEIKLSNSGIQSIQNLNNLVIIGFWNGLIKGYEFDTFNELFKISKKLPIIETTESNIGNQDENKFINDRLRLCTIKLMNALQVTSKTSTFKSMVKSKRNIMNRNLLITGYEDGSIVVYEI